MFKHKYFGILGRVNSTSILIYRFVLLLIQSFTLDSLRLVYFHAHSLHLWNTLVNEEYVFGCTTNTSFVPRFRSTPTNGYFFTNAQQPNKRFSCRISLTRFLSKQTLIIKNRKRSHLLKMKYLTWLS